MRGDHTIDQPAQKRPCTVGGVHCPAVHRPAMSREGAISRSGCRSNRSFTLFNIVMVDPTSAWRIDLVASTSTITP
jgi:hypothetical protein